MPPAKKNILEKMLDRLFAGLASGPNLNCRPHSSRQRIDWTQFARLQDLDPAVALQRLFSSKQSVDWTARVPAPQKSEKPGESKRRSKAATSPAPERELTGTSPAPEIPSNDSERDVWTAQQSLLTKLRGLAEDARDYEQDTGVHVLHVGFPLLSLPPGVSGLGGSKRLLAPLAFVSVSLQIQAGAKTRITIEGLHDGADFLVPNEALFAWLERQTGKRLLPETGLNTRAEVATANTTTEAANTSDGTAPNVETTGDSAEPANSPAENADGTDMAIEHDPIQELNDLIQRVAEALQLPAWKLTPDAFTELRPAPRGDEEEAQPRIVASAVMGLFPMNNQGLLRDMQQMIAEPRPTGPLESFLTLDVQLEPPEEETRSPSNDTSASSPIADERLVTLADPCQALAVRRARECRGLVVHGPPGTGKSQTITNMIGDHLARGQRVLLVCDKRTALDVVFQRLDHLGLGQLCAVVHDPQHDQRNLYKQIKDQLDELTASKPVEKASARLDAVGQKLQRAYEALGPAWHAVMRHDPDRGGSFHERAGEWLQSAPDDLEMTLPVEMETSDTPDEANGSAGKRRKRRAKTASKSVEAITAATFAEHETALREFLTRAIATQFLNHPWRHSIGVSLDEFLRCPHAQVRADLHAVIDLCRELDESPHDALGGFVPTAKPAHAFAPQAVARREFAARLEWCFDHVEPAWCRQFGKQSGAAIERMQQTMRELSPAVEVLRRTPLDAELRLAVRDQRPTTIELRQFSVDLQHQLSLLGTWRAWFAFSSRQRAAEVLRRLGLVFRPDQLQRALTFFEGLLARIHLQTTINDYTPAGLAESDLTHDERLLTEWERLTRLLDLLAEARTNPLLAPLAKNLIQAIANSDRAILRSLDESAALAESLDELHSELTEIGLFREGWVAEVMTRAGRGEALADELQSLASRVDELPDLLRVVAMFNELPPTLQRLVLRVLERTTDVDEAFAMIRHRVLTQELSEWIASVPELQGFDGFRLTNLMREIQQWKGQQQECVRDLILETWLRRQRDRLLVSTGSRLNGLAASLRRRLITRGDRAMRLRQVIATGAQTEGGDPLFDLRPVWMASPETVAQIFPRQDLFDVVIFDEASQCRLEEALPVLTRARRVVIAGDPKQLPPTRFFESGVVTSDDTVVETESDLFEAHQSEIEDLLTAALSLEIQESYLDVHYRSRNADLVEFSNEQFYGTRLQAIPGHPSHRTQFPPISLYHVNGLYDQRCNEQEALEVCRIVADLLRRAEPPSIGIACFNLTQRDLILEKLAERSAEDSDFAERLAAARQRVGSGAFEGLFVKNLENVQGDERDHMIISTTYGPDKQGRFYKRFGPLGQSGGGRRLNVLVTRARDEVHLVTSIPRSLYRNLAPVPKGQQPGGAWLLFAYLAYTEELAEHYRTTQTRDTQTGQVKRTVEWPTRTPSAFACEVARRLAEQHHLGSDVHWGNEGFCIDVAVQHPTRPADRTLGLLCDGTRFQLADNAVEWDLFRTAVMQSQGWQLQRCWSPEFFRDPAGTLRRIVSEAARIAATDPDPDVIPVEPT